MTSAPMSARTIVQKGPARTRVRSKTRIPDSGPAGGSGLPFRVITATPPDSRSKARQGLGASTGRATRNASCICYCNSTRGGSAARGEGPSRTDEAQMLAPDRRFQVRRFNMSAHIFVVQPIMPEALDLLKTLGTVEVFALERMISRPELLDGMQRADYLFTLGDTTIDDDILANSPKLKGIAAMAMGLTGVVDVDAATRRGIPVTNVPHYITKTTCDLTMAIILGLAWRLVEADRFTRCGRFHQEQSMSFLCHSLPGKTAGLVGLGGIGLELVKRLRAFELDVIYTKRNRLSAEEEAAP